MKEKTKAYAAGLLDAEGSCYIGKTLRPTTISYNPDVRISSKHLPTLKWMVKHFGGSVYGASKNRSDEYNWQYSSQVPAGKFLKTISPYIILKDLESANLQEYIDLNGKTDPQRRERLFQEAQRLNQRSRESVTTSTQDFLKWKRNLINAYVAGLLDGDGWVTIIKTPRDDGRPQYFRVLAIEQESRGLAELVQAAHGGTIVTIPSRKPTEVTKYRWTLRVIDHQEKFVLGVLPYLIEKRERAKVLLEMIRLGSQMCPEKRHELWKRMRILNEKKIKSDLMGDHESDPTGT